MSLSPENRARALAATREASAAFIEDMAHIREQLAQQAQPARNLRHLSGILRRLLVDGGGDLRSIAPPRIGKLSFLAPDNSPFYGGEPKNPLPPGRGIIPSMFFSGGLPIFDLKFRAISMGWVGDRMPRDFDPDATVTLGHDGFLNQRVISLHHEWATRRDVIKYVANVASGVHSGQPKEATEKLLSRARRWIRMTPEGGALKMEFDTSAVVDPLSERPYQWAANTIDVVLMEIRSAAHFLATSPDIVQLEKMIVIELS